MQCTHHGLHSRYNYYISFLYTRIHLSKELYRVKSAIHDFDHCRYQLMVRYLTPSAVGEKNNE